MLGDVIQNRVQVFGRNLAKVGRHVAEQLFGSPISGIGVSRSKVGHDFVNNLKKRKLKKIVNHFLKLSYFWLIK